MTLFTCLLEFHCTLKIIAHILREVVNRERLCGTITFYFGCFRKVGGCQAPWGSTNTIYLCSLVRLFAGILSHSEDRLQHFKWRGKQRKIVRYYHILFRLLPQGGWLSSPLRKYLHNLSLFGLSKQSNATHGYTQAHVHRHRQNIDTESALIASESTESEL